MNDLIKMLRQTNLVYLDPVCCHIVDSRRIGASAMICGQPNLLNVPPIAFMEIKDRTRVCGRCLFLFDSTTLIKQRTPSIIRPSNKFMKDSVRMAELISESCELKMNQVLRIINQSQSPTAEMKQWVPETVIAFSHYKAGSIITAGRRCEFCSGEGSAEDIREYQTMNLTRVFLHVSRIKDREPCLTQYHLKKQPIDLMTVI